MAMQILKLEIGSAEWKAVRSRYKVASEAAAMMGADPNFKRSDLLRLKASGIEREINEWVEKFIFKRGHETEALARPIAEEMLGDDLYPIVGVNTVEGLALLASFDGITMPVPDLHWEHKQFNKELFEIVKAQGELPLKIVWQLEHQMLVNENDYCIFAVSDGTPDKYAQMEYHSRPERRAELIEGWKHFDKDLENYTPEVESPIIEGEIITDLPSLDVEVASEVKRSNLTLYKANIMDFLGRINEDLQSDHDFATAKNVVKFLKDREEEIAFIEKKIIDGSSSTGETMRTLTSLHEALRTKRLNLDKLVSQQEKSRREEAISKAKTEWLEYLADVNLAISPYRMPPIEVDFIGASKNRRTLATYREAVNNELSRAKRAASLTQKRIADNIAAVAFAEEYMFLFRDMQELITKDQEALVAIAQQRISEHKTAEQAKIDNAAQKLADERIAAAKSAPAPAPATPAQGEPITQYPNENRRAPGAVIGTRAGSKPTASIHYAHAPQAALAPPARDIITAVAVAFSVDNITALEWIAGINLDAARAMLAQDSRKGAKVS